MWQETVLLWSLRAAKRTGESWSKAYGCAVNSLFIRILWQLRWLRPCAWQTIQRMQYAWRISRHWWRSVSTMRECGLTRRLSMRILTCWRSTGGRAVLFRLWSRRLRSISSQCIISRFFLWKNSVLRPRRHWCVYRMTSLALSARRNLSRLRRKTGWFSRLVSLCSARCAGSSWRSSCCRGGLST